MGGILEPVGFPCDLQFAVSTLDPSRPIHPLDQPVVFLRLFLCRRDDLPRQAKAVVAAARKEPEKYDRLVQRMDRTGRVRGAYRELEIAREADRLQDAPQPLPEGPFHVAVVDPPWSHQDEPYSLSRERGVKLPGDVP